MIELKITTTILITIVCYYYYYYRRIWEHIFWFQISLEIPGIIEIIWNILKAYLLLIKNFPLIEGYQIQWRFNIHTRSMGENSIIKVNREQILKMQKDIFFIKQSRMYFQRRKNRKFAKQLIFFFYFFFFCTSRIRLSNFVSHSKEFLKIFFFIYINI